MLCSGFEIRLGCRGQELIVQKKVGEGEGIIDVSIRAGYEDERHDVLVECQMLNQLNSVYPKSLEQCKSDHLTLESLIGWVRRS